MDETAKPEEEKIPQLSYNVTYSDYRDGTPFIDSPLGTRLWLHPDSDRKKIDEFLSEINALIRVAMRRS
jgi:hypothetical protein